MSGAAWIDRLRCSPSPCVRTQLARAGVDPAAFAIDDLARLPALTPEDLDLDRHADPVGHLRLGDAPPPRRLGTCRRDGRTIVLTWTAADLERSAASGARALRTAGVAPGMKVANTLEGGFTTPGSLALGDALEALGALDVPLGPAPDEKTAASLAALVERVGIDVVVVDPGGAGPFLSLLDAGRMPSVAGVVWTGDSAPRLSSFAGWCRRWLSVPEVSTFAAMACARGALHLDPELVPEWRGGRLLLGGRGGDAPLLLYDAGLRAVARPSACACGDSGPVIVVN